MSTVAAAGLFEAVEDRARRRLAEGPMGRLLPGEAVVDLFAGAGGWDQGAMQAGLPCHAAINHDEVAIATHERNHPACLHFRGDAWRVRPATVMRAVRERFGLERLGVLLASAACTTHSPARGAAPISPRVHMLGWCIARWMRDERPRLVLIENVVAWRDWGPTIAKLDGRGRPVVDAQGRPVRVQCPRRRGSEYRRWMRFIRGLGYHVEERVLEAADYGSASRRRRLYLVCRRDGEAVAWPEPTHAGRHRAAAEVIDWTDLGTSVLGRKRPLKHKTLGRIAEGVRRYVLQRAEPFTVQVTYGGDGWRVSGADAPLATQTTRQDLAVATPVLATTRNGERRGQRPRCGEVGRPLNTVVNGPTQGLAVPVLSPCGGPKRQAQGPDTPMQTLLTREDRGLAVPVMAYLNHGAVQSGPVDGSLRTVVAGGGHAALATPVLMNNTTHHTGGPVSGPAPTVTTGGQSGLAVPVMALFRGQCAGSSPEGPLPTITAGNGPGRGAGCGHAQGVVVPVIAPQNSGVFGAGADEPGPTITTRGHQSLVAPVLAEYFGNGGAHAADEPVRCITCRDRRALVCPVMDGLMDAAAERRAARIGRLLRRHLGTAVRLNERGMALATVGGVELVIVDILFRMLQPHELSAAMGFPAEYRWPKQKRHAVRLIGNAVHVEVARALVAATLPGQRRRAARRAA